MASAISPLFAVPLGAIFLGERLTLWLVAGVAVAVAGIILIS
ncbi:MAG: EamA family transporter [Dehalococcoidia bacterium]|nr:EamA family transporter [Dehalococcoidia bacterium]